MFYASSWNVQFEFFNKLVSMGTFNSCVRIFNGLNKKIQGVMELCGECLNFSKKSITH